MDTKFNIRSANFDDLPNISDTHIRCWKETYVGQIPQEYLDSMDVSEQLKKWENSYNNEDYQYFHINLAFLENNMAGFISFGSGRDQEMRDYGEIYTLYVTRNVWGQGAGYALFKTSVQTLSRLGIKHLYLWTLETNKQAIRAYKRWGGILDPTKTKEMIIKNQSVKEVAVMFDISLL